MSVEAAALIDSIQRFLDPGPRLIERSSASVSWVPGGFAQRISVEEHPGQDGRWRMRSSLLLIDRIDPDDTSDAAPEIASHNSGTTVGALLFDDGSHQLRSEMVADAPPDDPWIARWGQLCALQAARWTTGEVNALADAVKGEPARHEDLDADRDRLGLVGTGLGEVASGEVSWERVAQALPVEGQTHARGILAYATYDGPSFADFAIQYEPWITEAVARLVASDDELIGIVDPPVEVSPQRGHELANELNNRLVSSPVHVPFSGAWAWTRRSINYTFNVPRALVSGPPEEAEPMIASLARSQLALSSWLSEALFEMEDRRRRNVLRQMESAEADVRPMREGPE